MTAKKTLLFAALAAAMFAAAPVLAQDAPPETTQGDSGVPKDRLVDAYAGTLFDGDEALAGDTVTALRTGGDFTVTTTETHPVLNADGTPATNPDGTPKMETVTVETIVANPNGPMGWGEVDHSLGIAQALVDSGQAGSFEEALMGTATTTTVTNADGTTTTTTTYSGGILQMRADGMGWGQIAKELGFKSLGEIKSGRYADADDSGDGSVAADHSAKGKDKAAAAGGNHGKSGDHKVAAGGKPDHAGKPDRVTGKPDKVERVAKVERPTRPERPERPSKPDRGGRP